MTTTVPGWWLGGRFEPSRLEVAATVIQPGMEVTP